MVQNHRKPNSKDSSQFLYLGRWVSKKNFRTFVYSKNDKKLANNYDEYQKLIESGTWFNTQEDAIAKTKLPEVKELVAPKLRKPDHGANS